MFRLFLQTVIKVLTQKSSFVTVNILCHQNYLSCSFTLFICLTAACSACSRATKSRSSCWECHDGGQRPPLCTILENGSSGKTHSFLMILFLALRYCLSHQCMFSLSQGVPVMAIRNKMVLEGLDPNLLEWVSAIISDTRICVPVKLIINTSVTSVHSTPDAPVPDGGTGQDQDVAATSSDSESSFSDWHSSPPLHHPLSPQSFLWREPVFILSFCSRYWERSRRLFATEDLHINVPKTEEPHQSDCNFSVT